MENRDAIDAVIRNLNIEEFRKTSPVGTLIPDEVPTVWQQIPDYFALTKFEYPNESNSGAIFNPSFGVPVKVFMNLTTGEIRTFSGNIFQQ